jgi:hypothetical protein
MKPLHLKQCIDASIFRFCIYVYRRRFITNAKQPANNPPPKIVVPNERYALAPLPGAAPSSRSRTPPCTISTERVSTAPIANHHLNDLTDVPETERQKAWMRHLSATVAEGRQAVKKTAFYLTPPLDRRRTGLTAGARRDQAPLSILDGERQRHSHYRCPPSRVRALQPPSL